MREGHLAKCRNKGHRRFFTAPRDASVSGDLGVVPTGTIALGKREATRIVIVSTPGQR